MESRSDALRALQLMVSRLHAEVGALVSSAVLDSRQLRENPERRERRVSHPRISRLPVFPAANHKLVFGLRRPVATGTGRPIDDKARIRAGARPAPAANWDTIRHGAAACSGWPSS